MNREAHLQQLDQRIPSEQVGRVEWRHLKAVMSLVALGVAYYGFWLIRCIYLSFADNSDVLYLASLYRDLASHHYPLSGWRLTPAPYFFPDMPLFFLSAAVTPNLPSAYCLYGGIVLSAIFGCMYWIGGAVSHSRANRLLTVGLIALLMFLPTLRSQSYWIPMRWLLAPSGHSGSLLCGLILIGLTLGLLRRLTSFRMIAFASISLLALVSDQLILSQFLVPIVVATLMTAIIYRKRQHLIACAAIAASSVIAWRAAIWALHVFVRGSTFEISPLDTRLGSWDQVAHWWPQFKQDWHDVADPCTPVFMIALASLLAVVVTVIHARSAKHRLRSSSGTEAVSFMAWVTVASLALSAFVPLLMGFWGNIDCFRYEMSWVALPILLLVLCGTYSLHCLPETTGTEIGFTALAAGVILSLPMRSIPPFKNADAFYPPTVLAFDQLKREFGLHAGYADYWLSRPVTMFSKEHLLVSPLEADDHALAPILWCGNPNHWCEAPDGKPGEYPIYDFAVCPSVGEGKIRQHCGAPAKVIEFNHMRILIYNRPSDVLFRNLCRAIATSVADAPLESPIVKQRFLNHIKLAGHPWFGPDTKILQPGESVELKLQRPIVADLLNITANSGRTYQIELKLGESTVGKTRLMINAGDNLQPNDLLLAPITGGKAFDRIIITANKALGYYSIGSVMAFADPVLHPIRPREK